MKSNLQKKKIILNKTLIIISSILSIISLNSCKNFFQGQEVLQELNSMIEEANTPVVSVKIYARSVEGGGTEGTTIPSGITDIKVNKAFEVSFTENAGYEFVRWEASFVDTGLCADSFVRIESPTSKKTKITILKQVSDIWIYPVCNKRPLVMSNSPIYVDGGNPRDSSIVVVFDKTISKDNDFSELEINCNGSSILGCFDTPVVNENILTIPALHTSLIDVPQGSVKNISVKFPGTIYYMNDSNEKVSLGSELKWEYNINNTTINKTEITCSVSSEKGTVTPTNTNKYNLQETFNLSYKPNDNYYFNGWNIVDSKGNDVSSTVLQVSDYVYNAVTQAYESSITVKDSATGISITPDAKLLPNVEKINFENNRGVSCDETIVVTFNKKMEKSQMNHYGSDSVIQITDNYGNDISDYYNSPTVSEDGKTVFITPNLSTISSLFVGNSEFDIKVIILKEAKDDVENENLTMKKDYIASIRLSATRERIKPEFITFNIARTKEDAKNGKNLFTEKDFTDFTDEDVDKNLANKLWIYCKAKDTGGPIKSLLTTEKLIQNDYGLPVSQDYKTLIDGYGDFTTVEDNVYEALFEYNFAALIDGINQMTFRLCDYAGNESDVEKEYTIVKDTTISSSKWRISMKKTNVPSVNNIDTRKIDFYMIGDVHTATTGKNKIDQVFFKIYVGKSENKLEKVYEGDGTTCIDNSNDSVIPIEISYDCSSDTIIRMEGVDIAGNIGIEDFIISKTAEIQGFFVEESGSEVTIITEPTLALTSTQYYSTLVLQSFNGGELEYLTKTSPHLYGKSYTYDFSGKPEGTYRFYFEHEITHESTAKNFDKNYKIYTCPSEYVEINWTGENIDFGNSIPVNIQESDLPDYSYSFSNTVNEDDNFLITTRFADGFIPKEHVQYFVKITFEYFAGYTVYNYSYFNNNLIEFPASEMNRLDKYSISVIAINNVGKLVESEPKKLNATGITNDYTAPVGFSSGSIISYYPNEQFVEKAKFPKDTDSGLYEEDGFYKVDYYYVPVIQDIYSAKYFSKDVVKGYKKHTTFYKEDSEKIHFYWEGEQENTYQLYYELSDKAGNTLMARYGDGVVSSCISHEKPILSYDNSANCIKVFFNKKENNRTITLDRGTGKPLIIVDKLKNNIWENTVNKLDYSTVHTAGELELDEKDKADEDDDIWYKDYSVDEESTFYRINAQYFVEGSDSVILVYSYTTYVCPESFVDGFEVGAKNIVEGALGISVLCDKPAFIHTVCSPQNYENDIDIWETRTQEVDIKMGASSFIYSIPKEKIPKNYYYVTIVHFADGDTYAFPVQQNIN